MVNETMYAITTYTIEKVSSYESDAISTLLKLLDDCPIPLSNDDYVSIFRAIANHDKDADGVDGLNILYEE